MEIGLTILHCSVCLLDEIRDQMRSKVNGYALNTAMFLNSDIGADLLYRTSHPTLTADYSRFVVDLNRNKDEQGLNGVVVPFDYDYNWLYIAGETPENQETQRRIASYWEPFHLELAEMVEDIDILIDCHTMGGEVTERYVGNSGTRPDICVANGGNEIDTCSEIIFRDFMKELEKRFPELRVGINNPFSGGHIVKYYGGKTDTVMVELKTELYFDRERHLVNYGRATEINARLRDFFESLSEI